MEGIDLVRPAVDRRRQQQICGNHTLRIDPQIEGDKTIEALDQEPSPNGQDYREPDL